MAVETSTPWDAYFSGSEPPAEGGVNWEAYSHEELYQMLWQDADVADVSTVATEWARHRAALNTHAEVLREQRVALEDSWQGPAAEEAATRLDALAARVEKISELAGAGQQVAQDAADALAMARAMMPPPAGTPAAPAAPAAPAMPSFSPAPNYAEMFTPTPATSTSGMSTAFGAVGSGGFSFYFGSAATDQQKAQAVRAMQAYESNLTGSSRLIDEARSAIPPAAATSPAAQATAGPAAPANTGVPWQRLVGAVPIGGPDGVGMGAVIGGPGAGHGGPLGPGARVGALGGMPGGPGMPGAQLAAESAAARAGHGVMPPVGGQRGGAGSDDERHENQLPTIDHGLFAVEEPPSSWAIGHEMGDQP